MTAGGRGDPDGPESFGEELLGLILDRAQIARPAAELLQPRTATEDPALGQRSTRTRLPSRSGVITRDGLGRRNGIPRIARQPRIGRTRHAEVQW